MFEESTGTSERTSQLFGLLHEALGSSLTDGRVDIPSSLPPDSFPIRHETTRGAILNLRDNLFAAMMDHV